MQVNNGSRQQNVRSPAASRLRVRKFVLPCRRGLCKELPAHIPKAVLRLSGQVMGSFYVVLASISMSSGQTSYLQRKARRYIFGDLSAAVQEAPGLQTDFGS